MERTMSSTAVPEQSCHSAPSIFRSVRASVQRCRAMESEKIGKRDGGGFKRLRRLKDGMEKKVNPGVTGQDVLTATQREGTAYGRKALLPPALVSPKSPRSSREKKIHANFPLKDRLQLLNSISWLRPDTKVQEMEARLKEGIGKESKLANNSGNIESSVQEIGDDQKLLDTRLYLSLHLLLCDWFGELERETSAFNSPFIGAQVKLAEAVRLAGALPTPNEFISTLTLNLLWSLSDSFFNFRQVVKEAHAIMYESVYDGDSRTPFFARLSAVQNDIDALRVRRREVRALQKQLCTKGEKDLAIIDKTVEELEHNLLRRTFIAWKKFIMRVKRHNQQLQFMFSKWWIGEDLKRWYFNHWQLFRDVAIAKRLHCNLDRGQADLEFHESVMADKVRLHDKKKANVKSLEADFQSKNKLVEEQRKALAAINFVLLNQTKILERNKELSAKLQKLCESVGHGIMRNLQGQLNKFTKTPDAQDVLDRVNKEARDCDNHLTKVRAARGHADGTAGDTAGGTAGDTAGGTAGDTAGDTAGYTGEDLLLAWLKLTLGRYYASSKAKAKAKHEQASDGNDSVTNKKILLDGVNTIHQLMELGLGLDLIECIPPILLAMCKRIPDDQILLGDIDIEQYSHNHVQLVSTLAKCHVVAVRGMIESQMLDGQVIQTRASVAVPIQRRRYTTVVRRGTFTHSCKPSAGKQSHQNSVDGGLLNDTAADSSPPVSFLDSQRTSFSVSPGAESETSMINMFGAQKTTALSSKTNLNQPMLKLSEGGAESKEKEEKESFIDETLPLVGMEELLVAFDPVGEHEQLVFLQTFLLTFFLGNPILSPVLLESHEVFHEMQGARVELAHLIETQKARNSKPDQDVESIEASSNSSRNIEDLTVDIQETRENWKRILERCSDILQTSAKRAKYWIKAKRHVEQRVWHLLSSSNSICSSACGNPSADAQTPLNTLGNTSHSAQLPKLQGKKSIHQTSLITKRELIEITRLVLTKRFRGVKEANAKLAEVKAVAKVALKSAENRVYGQASDINRSDLNGSSSSSENIQGLREVDEHHCRNSVDVTWETAHVMCESLDTISLALKRYSRSGSVIDMLKEAALLDADKFVSKKLRPKFTALGPAAGQPIQLTHIVEALIFAAECHLEDGGVHPNANDLDAFPQLLWTHVLDKLVTCENLVDRQLYYYKEPQLKSLHATFDKMRTKDSPVGQVSLSNWKNAIEARKATLLDTVHVSKATLEYIFTRCAALGSDIINTRSFSSIDNDVPATFVERGQQPSDLFANPEQDKVAGLCFTQFVAAIVKVALLKFPDPFQPFEQKLHACAALFNNT